MAVSQVGAAHYARQDLVGEFKLREGIAHRLRCLQSEGLCMNFLMLVQRSPAACSRFSRSDVRRGVDVDGSQGKLLKWGCATDRVPGRSTTTQIDRHPRHGCDHLPTRIRMTRRAVLLTRLNFRSRIKRRSVKTGRNGKTEFDPGRDKARESCEAVRWKARGTEGHARISPDQPEERFRAGEAGQACPAILATVAQTL